MSRSKRGGKAPGFEYWTARPFNKHGGAISPRGGKHTKRRTHKAERRIGKQDALRQKEVEQSTRGHVPVITT